MPTDLDSDEAELFKNPKGAIPVTQVQKILANTRTKTEARVRSELEAEYGVAPAVYKQLDLRAHTQAFLANPVTYWRDLGVTLQNAGIRLPSLTGAAPGWTGPPAAARGPAAPTEAPKPDIIATLEDGTKVETFSAGAMGKMLEWQLSQLEKKFGDRLAPLVESHEHQQETQILQTAHQQAAEQFAEAKTWPNFAEIQKDVYELMKRDARYSLEGAYNKLFREKIYPNLEATHRQKFNKELKSAPPATTISPTGAVPRRPGSGKRESVGWDQAIESALDQHAARS